LTIKSTTHIRSLHHRSLTVAALFQST